MITVKLTKFDVLHAAQVGLARNLSGIWDHRNLGDGRIDMGFDRHIAGAIGEYAWAIGHDRLWRPIVGGLDTDRGDVAGLQIRTTWRKNGCLIIRPEDSDHARFGSVVLDLPLAHLRGPVLASDYKLPEFFREEGPGVYHAAYFVPVEVLG